MGSLNLLASCRPICSPRIGPYWSLLRFLVPLTMTLIAIDIGEQALNRALVSSFDAVRTLAAFGIAYMIIKLATGAISEIKLVSIMLVHTQANRRKILVCELLAGIMTIVIALIIGFTKIGYYIIDELHGIPESVGLQARKTIIYLSAFPMLDGLAWMHTGILLKFKYTFTVGAASIFDNVVQVITVVVLLQTNLRHSNSIVIPVLATYLGTLTRLLTVVLAYYRCIHSKLVPDVAEGDHEFDVHGKLTFKRILSFWVPLALVQLCQRICRPIVNLLVARDRLDGVTRETAVQAVAVLSLAYPIGHLPYGWLNTLRSIEPAFKKKMNENETKVTVKNIRIFSLCCFIFSFTAMIVLFWIPGVAPAILSKLNNANKELSDSAVRVLHIFSFFPIPVANRASLTGMFISKEQTKYLYPSVPTRLIVLISTLFILPRLGIHGAVLGVAALLSAFLSESLCVLVTAVVLKYKTSCVNTTSRDSNRILEEETVA